MKRQWIAIPLVAAAIGALGVPGLAKDTPVSSQWAAGPMKIDGLDLDWQGATFLTDPSSKAQYAVKNDGRNLYVLFLFNDDRSASTIDYTGLTVFFNTEGKKSKDLGVHFLKKDVTADALIASLEKSGETLTDEKKAELRKQQLYQMFEADVINAKKIPAPSDPAVKTDPPAYRSARKQRARSWELRIPLSRINQAGGIGAEPGKTIKLGFEWGGMTSEAMKDMMAGQISRGGAAHQGAELTDSIANPRDNAGTLSGGGDYRRDQRTMLHSFWTDLKLAAQ